MKLVNRAMFLVLVVVLALAGCKKEAKPEGAAPAEGKAAGAAPAKAEPAAPAAIALDKPANLPVDVLAYGGIAGFDALSAMVGELVAAFPGTPNPTAMMFQGIQASLNVTNLDWLDKARAVYFVAYDAKKYAENALVLFPVTSADAFAAALPATKTGDAATGFSYEFLGKKFFMKVIDGYVAMSNDQALTTAAEPFLKSSIIPLKLGTTVELFVPVKSILGLYGTEIDEGLKGLDQLAAGGEGTPAVPFLDAQVAASLKGMAAGVVAFARDIELVKVAFEYKDGTFGIPVTGVVAAGSKAAEKLGGMASRTSRLFKELPDASYLTFAFNIDPKLFLEYKDLSLKMYKEIFQLSDEDVAKIGGYLDKAYDLSTGDGAFSVASFGGFPFSLVMVSGLKDAKAYEGLLAELWTFVEPKLIAFFKAELAKQAAAGQPAPINIQGDTLQAVVDALKPLAEPMGVKIELINKDLKGFKQVGVSVSVDFNNPMWAANPEAALAKAFVGDKLSFVCAGRADNVYGCAFSPKADELMAAFADSKLGAGKVAGLSATATGLVSQASMFIAADVAGGLKQYSSLPLLGMFKAQIDALQAADLYFFLRGAATGFEAKLAVPVKLIAQVAAIFNGPAPAPAAPPAPAQADPAPAAAPAPTAGQ